MVLEDIKKNTRKRKQKGKMKEKTRENNNGFKINKLFLYVISNSFHLFSFFNINIK